MTPDTIVVCEGCERAIEVCAVCEDGGCAEAVCYRCVALDLAERVPEPHVHGG